jgi:general stress protein YciG
MPGKKTNDSKRGFASMDEEERREISAKGGRESGGNFAQDKEPAAEAGRKGAETRTSRRSR